MKIKKKIKINNNILKTYEHLYWTIFNLKSSKWEFNLKNIERELEFIEINVEYCILIMDMCFTVHNCFLFQYDNPKYKNKLINTIYTKIHKTIYDSEGNQKDNFKEYIEYIPENYEYKLSSGVYLDIWVKKL